MQEIKITRAATLKEKPESSTLVFGKAMTDHMFIVDYDEGQGWHAPQIHPCPWGLGSRKPQRSSTAATAATSWLGWSRCLDCPREPVTGPSRGRRLL